MRVRNYHHVYAALLCIVHSASLHAFNLTGATFFMPRSQSCDAARELTGMQRYINRYNQDHLYGTAAVTPAYYQSTRPERIAQALFGQEQLTISGSHVEFRGDNDILADYFGLPPTYSSTVCVKPRIRNALLDLQAYCGWHDFFFQIHAPVVWTHWDLGLEEKMTGSSSDFPAGYMAATATRAPARSFTHALQGTTTFGDMTTPIRCGKVCGSQNKAGVAEIQTALGWNFVNREHGHVGLSLRLGIPTGNRPKGAYFFEPIVGNGHHWELGAGFTGRVLIWEKDGEQELSFYADINLTHQFATEQCRTFDFCKTTTDDYCNSCSVPCCANNFGSRYILVKEFNEAHEYTGNLIPAINLSTVKTDISVAIQMDFVAMFGYTYNNFVFDIGYNGWLRSKEKASIKGAVPTMTYGFKGIQNVAPPDANTTESIATLYGARLEKQDDRTDNPSPRFLPPLNPDSAQSQKMLTHKLFTYFGYDFCDYLKEERQLTPFIGIGGALEFEGTNPRNQEIPHNTTLNQWSLWIKGGLAY